MGEVKGASGSSLVRQGSGVKEHSFTSCNGWTVEMEISSCSQGGLPLEPQSLASSSDGMLPLGGGRSSGEGRDAKRQRLSYDESRRTSGSFGHISCQPAQLLGRRTQISLQQQSFSFTSSSPIPASSFTLEHLPDHLLHKILGNIVYTKHAWASCRSVSSMFRSAIPLAAESLDLSIGAVGVHLAEQRLGAVMMTVVAPKIVVIETSSLHKDCLQPLRDTALATWFGKVGLSLTSLTLLEGVKGPDHHLWRPTETDRLAIVLRACPNIEHLEVQCCAIVGPNSLQVAPLTKLKRLVLGDLGIPTEYHLEQLLEACPVLESLELLRVSAPFRHLMVAGPSLQRLVLQDQHGSFTGLEVTAPKLRELRVLQPEGQMAANEEPVDYTLVCHNSPLLEILEVRLADHFCMERVDIQGSKVNAPLKEVHLNCASRWEKQVIPMLSRAGGTLKRLSVAGSPWEEVTCVPVQVDELQMQWPALEALTVDCSLASPSLEAACLLGASPKLSSLGAGSFVESPSPGEPWGQLQEVVLVQGRYPRSLISGLMHDFLINCPALKVLRLELQCCYRARLGGVKREGRFEADLHKLQISFPLVDIVISEPKDHRH